MERKTTEIQELIDNLGAHDFPSKVHKKNVFCDPKFSTQNKIYCVIQSLVRKNNFFRDPKFSTQKQFILRSKV